MAGKWRCLSRRPTEWLKGKVIGSGSFGTVHLAIDSSTGALFVVKSAISDAGVKSLKNEASILENLDSPYIVKCIGKDVSFAENGEIKYNLFMEYMAGGSLSDVAQNFGGALNEKLIRLYTRQILEGLRYLHKNGIVHSDVKCKNVLLGASGAVKLADFGCAKRLNDNKVSSSKTSSQRCNGIGGLLFGWLLRPPWGLDATNKNPMAALLKIAKGHELPEFPRHFSAEGLDFLQKCLERDPEKRWKSEQLAGHPFVTGKPTITVCSRKEVAFSPTSVLDVASYDSECDDDDSCSQDELVSRVPFSVKRCFMEQNFLLPKHASENQLESSDNWITAYIAFISPRLQGQMKYKVHTTTVAEGQIRKHRKVESLRFSIYVVMTNKNKKKVVINKEEAAENWCFVCKDGGDIRICDYKQCLKSYHPHCVRKDDSFLNSENYWACGDRGFCNSCLKLVLLIEENKDHDSDGERVDFTDHETYEGLFMEYYMNRKREEGFESGDIYAAQDLVKIKKNHQPDSGSEEFDGKEEEEEQVSDSDDLDYKKRCRKKCKGKRYQRKKSVMQTPAKSTRNYFIGWASRPLVEFLASIGKSTSEEMSQRDVTSIINEVYDLLEAHFAENHDESEDSDPEYDSEDNNGGKPNECKKQKRLDMGEKSEKQELENNVPKSCFASVVVENVKLVYLKRSLLHELLKEPESFEEKVIGCFVRVKSDPYDYLSRNSYQLMQVKGVKTVQNGENNTEIVLLFSSVPKEIHMNLLSDDDFSEDECLDLRQKMAAGLLERPTVGDLEQKAKVLHKDITMHRIKKELALLQNLIDRANEKGWRLIPDLSELDSNTEDIMNDMKMDASAPKSILQCNPSDRWQNNRTSEEKAHHVHASPPERKQPLPVSERSASTQLLHGGTPNSELKHDNHTHRDLLQLTSEEKTNKSEAEQSSLKSQDMHNEQATSKTGQDASKTEVIELLSNDDNANSSKVTSILDNRGTDDPERQEWCIQGPCGEQDKCTLSVLKRWSETSPYASKFKVWKEDQSEENAVWLLEAINNASCSQKNSAK
ncbi:UNVERIFIED_CONTAM: hypothetical protein Slati_3243900 [Sesamum latifolium]|uniref:Uncharacterized protein n=1 Tax=Sesamum latifolium TaxID=2727402 RepID=A0AAW2UZ89_9LAMI